MSSRGDQEPQRRKGPISGIIKLIGTGVGAAAEYRGHRKERKAAYDSAQASPEEYPANAGPSSQPVYQRATSNNSPPSYSQSTNYGSDRQLAAGPPAANDKKDIDDSSSDYSDYLSDEIEDDEEAWQLDEVAAATEPPSYDAATREDTDAFERDLAIVRQQRTTPIGKLPLPVILPQRRPRNKSRGFVRAYSPVLQDVGIDQATFLRFLENFHASSQANPWFNAVLVAATIAGFVPEPITMAVTTAVQVAAGAGKEFDSRRKTNNFLDRMNEALFKPAGCYAFIMKYKPDSEIKQGGGLLAKLGVGIEDVDFSASKAVAKYDAESRESGKASKSAKFRLTSGATKGSAKMVEAAPLIYPEIDEVVYSGKDGQETFKDKAKDAGNFLASYVDRRAQMTYVSFEGLRDAVRIHQLTSMTQAKKDPNSTLVIPESQRQSESTSKWADPNHPMFNGGLVGLVSGGYLDAGKRRAEKRERKLERKEARWERRYGPRPSYPTQGLESLSLQGVDQQRPDYYSRRSSGRRGMHPRDRAAQRGRKDGGIIGSVRKIMQEDVLYLMIVPMPSEAEIAEAREMIRLEKEKK